jgi:hypothetical protein
MVGYSPMHHSVHRTNWSQQFSKTHTAPGLLTANNTQHHYGRFPYIIPIANLRYPDNLFIHVHKFSLLSFTAVFSRHAVYEAWRPLPSQIPDPFDPAISVVVCMAVFSLSRTKVHIIACGGVIWLDVEGYGSNGYLCLFHVCLISK